MIGLKFGRWTVNAESGRTKSRIIKWLCTCDCGSQRVVDGNSLRRGKSTSCGCAQKEIAANISKTITKHKLLGRFKPIIGCKFGRLTVLEYAGNTSKRRTLWKCMCDCGKQTIVLRNSLVRGSTKSCGCMHKEIATVLAATMNKTHGKSGSKEYKAWLNMRARCADSNVDRFYNYGGRGIKVCDRWSDFSSFISDMGKCPPGYTIERIDVNKGYESSNCRWATPHEQRRNTTVNRIITIDNTTMVFVDWCRHFNIKPGTVYSRLKRGWDIIVALTTPVK
jgi:hypothetical protein